MLIFQIVDSLQHVTLFEHLVETHVKPSLNQFNSLQAQTEKYENLQRENKIQAKDLNLQNFVQFSLDALEEMGNQFLVLEKSVRFKKTFIKLVLKKCFI